MMVVVVDWRTPSPMGTAAMRGTPAPGAALRQFDCAIELEPWHASRRSRSRHRPCCEHCGKNHANDGFSNKHRYLKSSYTAYITFFRLSRSTGGPAFKEGELNRVLSGRTETAGNGARIRRRC